MGKRLKLILLYGGKSGEHEISLISAASVLKALDAVKYEVIPIAIDKNGQLFQNNYQELLNFSESLPVNISGSLSLPSLISNGKVVLDAAVVFPVLHGPLYEDGCMQGLLELANVAYVGCDVLSSAICMNKDITRRLVINSNIKYINFARNLVLHASQSVQERKFLCQQLVVDAGWPLFVKPCTLGSSLGSYKVNNFLELESSIEDAFRYDYNILIEEFIIGSEVELAILENKILGSPPHVSVPGEIIVSHADGFYSYDAKYLDAEQSALIIPAYLDVALVQYLQSAAAQIFMNLTCRGMARIDFFVNKEKKLIYFNEVNTIPGFTAFSMYPKLWHSSGIAYPDLLDRLIELALLHHQRKAKLVTSCF